MFKGAIEGIGNEAGCRYVALSWTTPWEEEGEGTSEEKESGMEIELDMLCRVTCESQRGREKDENE